MSPPSPPEAAASEATAASSARVAGAAGSARARRARGRRSAARCRRGPAVGRRTSVLGPVGTGRRGRHESGQDRRGSRRQRPAHTGGQPVSAAGERTVAESGHGEPAPARPGRRPSVRGKRASPDPGQAPRSAGTAASSRPAAAMAIAMPGQALTAGPPCGGVTRTRLTTRATTSPASAMAQPEYTRAMRLPEQQRAERRQHQARGYPHRRQPRAARAEQQQRSRPQPAAASPGRGQPGLEEEGRRTGEQVEGPGQENHPGYHGDDHRAQRGRGPSRRQAAQRHQRGGHRDGQISGTKPRPRRSRAAAQAALGWRGGPAWSMTVRRASVRR